VEEIILHHYPSSPFAEKVRVALGIKQLAWRSVIIPMILPKPDLMPLTGGYRKTPVMQIGADIYCDTQCILREIERRFEGPSLYRDTDAGTANALAFWSDRNLFSPAVGVAFAGRPTMVPAEFYADRSKFMGREISVERMQAVAPFMIDQLRAQLDWCESMLQDGRPFLLGQHPTLVDCAAYHPCWFIGNNLGERAAPLVEFPRLQIWMDRVKAIGHGKSTELDSKEALKIARDAKPQTQRQQDANDPLGRKSGHKVQVVPDDTGKDPVVGELIASSRDSIAVLHVDPQVGEVIVHFPRAGFVVRPADY
jgi:glutathione S-transferase